MDDIVHHHHHRLTFIIQVNLEFMLVYNKNSGKCSHITNGSINLPFFSHKGFLFIHES